jgi:hypothetical protein
MIKIKKLSLFLLLALLLTACKKNVEEDLIIETYSYEESDEVFVLEDDKIKFTLDPDTTYFEVLNKSNNSTWTSNPIAAADDPFADPESKKYLQSTLLIEYSNDAGMTTIYNNYEYSIIKKVYSVEADEDYIKVNYTIGDIEKTFNIPNALPESRMNIFLDRMDKKQRRSVVDYYRKIDINKLRPTDDKNELLGKYPELESEPVYELRENAQDYLKKRIEEIFFDIGYTAQDLEEDRARYGQDKTKEKPYFNVSIVYRLEDGELVVEVPFEDMQWRPNYPLTKVKLLPYLGAGSTEDEGFALVPDGNGGIINFNNGKNRQAAYYTEVYGWDSAMKREAVIDESRSAFPVFGISKNGSSLICILEDGKAVASIEADVSGRNHSYNYTYASYITMHSASVQVSAKTDRSVMVYEARKPEGVLKQRYKFLDTGSYSDMASSYRDYLIKNTDLVKNTDKSTPINITLIGAVDQVKQRLGIPVSVPTPLTSYDDAYNIITELTDKGYNNLSVRYSGWMNKGIKQKVLNKVKTISELGSKKKLIKLINHTNELGIPLYLEGAVMYAYDSNILDGFITNRDSARYTSREVVKLYSFSPIYYGIEDWKDHFYLLRPQRTMEYMQNLTDYTNKYSAKGVAFPDIGYQLAADYYHRNLTTRNEVLKMQEDKLKDIVTSGAGVIVNHGNDYVLPYVDFVAGMELKGKGYHIIDHSVPFYTMAIHGLVNYSGNPINLTGDFQAEILRSAENGAGLSFVFMKKPTSYLQNSNYTYYFATDYDLWKEEAYSIYSRYNNELGHIFDQYLIDHEIINTGVSVSTYEDGTKVYVNYNDYNFVAGDISIPANDYLVERR